MVELNPALEVAGVNDGRDSFAHGEPGRFRSGRVRTLDSTKCAAVFLPLLYEPQPVSTVDVDYEARVQVQAALEWLALLVRQRPSLLRPQASPRNVVAPRLPTVLHSWRRCVRDPLAPGGRGGNAPFGFSARLCQGSRPILQDTHRDRLQRSR
jgi:hypothetical protein